jgi:hypothetical protein
VRRIIQLIYIGICFAGHACFAQTDWTIKGGVFESGGNKRISSVTVTNLRTQQIRLSDEKGLFAIPAQMGDTLRFTKEGYSQAIMPISSRFDIVINMMPVIRLDEITITGRSRKEEMEEVMRDYRKQGTFYNGKPPPLSYIFTPVTALYELLGRTPRNARRFQNYMNNELEQQVVDRKFNRSVVTKYTGLEGDDLANFMAWYRPSYDKAQYWNEYDIIDYLKRSLEQFEKDGRPVMQGLPKLEIPPQEK